MLIVTSRLMFVQVTILYCHCWRRILVQALTTVTTSRCQSSYRLRLSEVVTYIVTLGTADLLHQTTPILDLSHALAQCNHVQTNIYSPVIPNLPKTHLSTGVV